MSALSDLDHIANGWATRRLPGLVDDTGAELLDPPATTGLVKYNESGLTAKHTAAVGVVEHG